MTSIRVECVLNNWTPSGVESSLENICSTCTQLLLVCSHRLRYMDLSHFSCDVMNQVELAQPLQAWPLGPCQQCELDKLIPGYIHACKS